MKAFPMEYRQCVVELTAQGWTTKYIQKAWVSAGRGSIRSSLPTLQPGDLVILDNLATHKLHGVAPLLAERDALALDLPPDSPDFNRIEQAFA
ncbi:MAG: transposase [Gemmataceae bacterium]